MLILDNAGVYPALSKSAINTLENDENEKIQIIAISKHQRATFQFTFLFNFEALKKSTFRILAVKYPASAKVNSSKNEAIIDTIEIILKPSGNKEYKTKKTF